MLLIGPLCAGLLIIVLAAACDRAMSLEDIRALQAEGRFEETIEPLRALLDAAPDDGETHLLYGVALSRTGAVRVAVWSLKKAAETPEWRVPATLELASTQMRAGNWQAAIEAAEAVIAAEPENMDAHILRGESILSEGVEPERALADFEFVLDKDPTSIGALTSKASALLMAGRVDEAAEAIDAAENIVDDAGSAPELQAQVCAVQAVLRRERRQLEEADERFEDCLSRFPTHAAVIEAALDYFDAKGDPARGNSILEKALELAPESLSYRETLSSRLVDAGDDARALVVLKQGLETSNEELRIAIWTDVTNYHLERDQLPEAIAAFEQALAPVEDPAPLAILTHADLLARAGRHEDALRVAKQLDNDAYVGLVEARVALDKGDPKRALARLDEVFPFWPNNAGARYYAARAAEQLGDFARAIEEYRQSIRSAPHETEAALRLAKLYLAAGAHEEAWNNATQYINVHRDDPEGARTVVASAERDENADLYVLITKLQATPKLWPAAVSTRAQFLARTKSPAAALAWLDGMPGPQPDWIAPVNAEALRTRVLLLEAAGRGAESRSLLASALMAHPEQAAFLEIKAALLEATAADPKIVGAAFEEALAKDPRDRLALEGVARFLERDGKTREAIALYDRATASHPESPLAAERAAFLAASLDDPSAVEKRWNELLKEHPWNPRAAFALAKIRSARKQADATTLELAERAVMFDPKAGPGEAGALLVSVLEARGERDRAVEVKAALSRGESIPPRKPMGDPGAPAPAERASAREAS